MRTIIRRFASREVLFDGELDPIGANERKITLHGNRYRIAHRTVDDPEIQRDQVQVLQVYLDAD